MLSYDELVKLARFCANQARTAQRTERIRQRPTRFKENKNALMRLPKNSGCGVFRKIAVIDKCILPLDASLLG
jgi:hypothetical protein